MTLTQRIPPHHPASRFHTTDALVSVYGDRHYARFHALETIARVPYFAYTSVLHLYEVGVLVFQTVRDACPRI